MAHDEPVPRLTLVPTSLVFPPPYDKTTVDHLAITNPHTIPVLYKVKTTNPQCFSARPRIGLLTPSETAHIKIAISNSDLTVEAVEKELFQIESRFLTDKEGQRLREGEKMDYSQCFKESAVPTLKHLVHCRATDAGSNQRRSIPMENSPNSDFATIPGPNVGRILNSSPPNAAFAKQLAPSAASPVPPPSSFDDGVVMDTIPGEPPQPGVDIEALLSEFKVNEKLISQVMRSVTDLSSEIQSLRDANAIAVENAIQEAAAASAQVAKDLSVATSKMRRLDADFASMADLQRSTAVKLSSVGRRLVMENGIVQLIVLAVVAFGGQSGYVYAFAAAIALLHVAYRFVRSP